MSVVIREYPCAECGSSRASLEAPCADCGWRPEAVNANDDLAVVSTEDKDQSVEPVDDWFLILLIPYFIFVLIECVPGILTAIPQINLFQAWPRMHPLHQFGLVVFWLVLVAMTLSQEFNMCLRGGFFKLRVTRNNSPVSFCLIFVLSVVVLTRITCFVMLQAVKNQFFAR